MIGCSDKRISFHPTCDTNYKWLLLIALKFYYYGNNITNDRSIIHPSLLFVSVEKKKVWVHHMIGCSDKRISIHPTCDTNYK
jgi:hypothetical protein